MITCRQFVEFLMEYLACELPSAQLDEFEAHLAACTACVSYMNSYRETIRLGKAVFADPDPPVPAEVPEELVSAILHARKRGT